MDGGSWLRWRFDDIEWICTKQMTRTPGRTRFQVIMQMRDTCARSSRQAILPVTKSIIVKGG